MNFVKKTILLLFSLFFIFSCRKDKSIEPIKTYGVGSDIKDYCFFKPGTWWVYEDSLTGNIDSVYVTNYSNYKFDANLSYNEKPAHCEYLQINTYSSLDGYKYNYWINTQWASENLIYNVVSCFRGNVFFSKFKFLLPDNLID